MIFPMFVFYCYVNLLDLHSFPTRRSSDLFDDITERKAAEEAVRESEARFRSLTQLSSDWYWEQEDRKSTRLNSSHEWISYAVFCLKKKSDNFSKISRLVFAAKGRKAKYSH